MKNNSLLRNTGLFLSLLFTTGCVNSEPENKLLNDIQSDLNKGLTVIVYQMSNKNKSTEQYADWSAVLNDFAASKGVNLKAYESNPSFNALLATKKIKHSADYTIFLKKNKTSYLYDGVIVEAMVYMTVDNTYNEGKTSPMFDAFMSDLTVIDF